MGNFSQWLVLREMEVEDDDSSSAAGPVSRLMAKPWVKNIVGHQPALAASAIAATSSGLADQLRQSTLGQGEPSHGGYGIGAAQGVEEPGFRMINVEAPQSLVGNWRSAKVFIAQETAEFLKQGFGNNYSRFDLPWTMVSKAPEGRQRNGLSVYHVQFAPPGRGPMLHKNLSSAMYEFLFTSDVVAQLNDVKLKRYLQGGQAMQQQQQQGQAAAPQTPGLPSLSPPK